MALRAAAGWLLCQVDEIFYFYSSMQPCNRRSPDGHVDIGRDLFV